MVGFHLGKEPGLEQKRLKEHLESGSLQEMCSTRGCLAAWPVFHRFWVQFSTRYGNRHSTRCHECFPHLLSLLKFQHWSSQQSTSKPSRYDKTEYKSSHTYHPHTHIYIYTHPIRYPVTSPAICILLPGCQMIMPWSRRDGQEMVKESLPSFFFSGWMMTDRRRDGSGGSFEVWKELIQNFVTGTCTAMRLKQSNVKVERLSCFFGYERLQEEHFFAGDGMMLLAQESKSHYDTVDGWNPAPVDR